MESKGYKEYKTKNGEIRYSSIIIVNRKVYHLASHDNKILAYKAHCEARRLINNMGIKEVQKKIRDETLRYINFQEGKYRNIIKHRNKFYFRYMKDGKRICSHGFDTPADAYMAYIERQLNNVKEF
jgi:hypothetical protein